MGYKVYRDNQIIKIQRMQQEQTEDLHYIDYPHGEKIVSLPLEFAYLPVDILSKQFTKLNSPHEYRIHYLGPRFTNTLTLHKKMAFSETHPEHAGVPNRTIPKYSCLNPKKIVNSFFINEKLRNNHFYKTGLYYRAFEGMNPSLDLDRQFIFNASFESANLDCVIKVKPCEFDLFLRIDSNTRGHLQWFYFSIENKKLRKKVKLNICNISKPGTFYESLMPPYFFSKRALESRGQDWAQGDKRISNISFDEKEFLYKEVLEEKAKSQAYCYSFEYEFEFQDDQVYFAYCIPYTYSEMMFDIEALPKEYVSIHKFTRSLTGLDVPLLKVTSSEPVSSQNKKNVLITARIHPGESNSSHVLKGFLRYLCSEEKSACEMRRRVNFYVIPMLNPDGVLLGNNRSGASGRDLNRMFIETDKQLFPEIHALKKFTSKMMNSHPFLIYYDFHGHSKKKNTFFYGPSYPLTHPNYYKGRVLAKLIEKVSNAFRYWSCMFTIHESKKSTGRAFMFQTAQIPFTYTIQSSIGYFYDSEKMKTFSFSVEAWNSMGEAICEGTSHFIISFEEYQNFLMERRLIRDKKKMEKLSLKRRSANGSRGSNCVEDSDDIYKPGEPLKIFYRGGEECLFMKVMEEVKDFGGREKKIEKLMPKGLDEQASSDDHDETEDFQLTKLKQFNNLIIQNARKDQNTIAPKFTEPNETKPFIRSTNSKNSSNNELILNENEKDFVFQEELNLFEEMRKKPGSSNSFRKKVTPNFSRPANRSKTGSMNSRISQTSEGKHQSFKREEDNERDEAEIWKTQEIDRLSFRKYYEKNASEEKKEESKTASARMASNYFQKSRKMKKKLENSHYSEMQFPDSEAYQNKNIFKHCKTDLFRKNIERKKQKTREKEQNQRVKHQSLHQSDLGAKPQEVKKELSLSSHPHTPHKLVEFRIQDLITNLENRSKMLKDSVKYRDEKKVKVKSNTMFPSSFYGVKQGLHTRRHPSMSADEQTGLTIKQFNAK